MLIYLEWFGSITAIIGAVLLAINIKSSPWAYIFFLLSNISLASWAFLSSYNGVFVMQSVLGVISITGIYRWIIHPAYYRNVE